MKHSNAWRYGTTLCGSVVLTGVVMLAMALSGRPLQAQHVIRGEVLASDTKEALVGANVFLKDTLFGTITDEDGSFLLRVDTVPVTLEITFTGFNLLEVVVSDTDNKMRIHLEPSSFLLETVRVEGSRVSERRKESPLTVESLDIIAIRETASNDFYDGLGVLKGVDLTTASLGFTIINTRGFNSTSPVRSLQIIDGVDNQAPGLNFSLGNFLGAPELDVLKVDLIQGASSAFYGPNAFNGVIDIQTKDPFIHQGLSVSIKGGERALFQGMVRYAKAFAEKFAFKINLSDLRANDWEARNYNPSFQSEADASNPGGYDAVNIYGDENVDLSRDATGLNSRKTFPGLLHFHRRGYQEDQLVDYNTENLKGNMGVFYRLSPDLEISAGVNIGSGTTVYQGENRFRLEGIFFWQGKVELRQKDRFFLRAYMTHEDAGNSYDAYTTALMLQRAAKSDARWTMDYQQYWLSIVTPKVKRLEGYPTISGPEFYTQQDAVFAMNQDSLVKWHADAQNYANGKSPSVPNMPFFVPGTDRFNEKFNDIISKLANDPENPGTRFYDKSALYHVQGEYKFETGFGDITAGGNIRMYRPDSKGTIFSDTSGVKITNREFGGFAGLSKKLIPARLTMHAVARVDKNENFKAVVSPAVSFVYTPNVDNVFRLSFSSALRNPTLADQYLYLNVGRAQLLGNISGFKDLVTPESFVDFLNTQIKDTLVYFDASPIQPEKVKSIEIGYRGTLFDRLWIDAGYHFNWYTDFIGYEIGLETEFHPIFTNFLQRSRIYRISTNARSEVTTQGFALGTNYYMGEYYNISGNYSWNVLNKKGTEDPIIPAFNTPKNKFNLGLSGRGMPLQLGGKTVRNLGFNINYKWIQGFLFEGSPQFTGEIPSYDLLDAQVNWKFQKIRTTLKLGATNVLDKRQFQTYGGPRVGRLAYISILYESK